MGTSKEVVSSQVEGTQATLVDLLSFEAQEDVDAATATADVQEVCNYLDWEGWIDFFLDGVATIADEAVDSAREMFALVAEDRTRVLDSAGTSVAALRLFELLPRHPIVSVAAAARHLDMSKPSAGRAVDALERARVLVEMTGRKRGRSWAYQAWLDRLGAGTELESRSEARW